MKPGTAFLIAGIVMSGGVYFFTALSGAVQIDKARRGSSTTTPDDRKLGRDLMIPVAGPFLGLRHTNSVLRQYGLGLNGTVQIAGLVLAFVGAVQQSRYRQAKRWGVAAAPGPDGPRIAVDVRF